MNWYKKSKKVQPKEENFAWVSLGVPKEIKEVHSDFTEFIASDDLYIEKKGRNDWSYGIEDDPHITVKWGIDFDDPEPIKEALDGEKGGNVTLEDIEIFEQDDYDVLVVKCKSKSLSKLHQKLTNDLNIEDKYPTYNPHITVAYLKKGMAKKYADMAKRWFTYYLLDFDFDTVVFEDTKDKKTSIKLSK